MNTNLLKHLSPDYIERRTAELKEQGLDEEQIFDILFEDEKYLDDDGDPRL